MVASFLVAAALAVNAQVVVTHFGGGLNDTDASATIRDDEAQDILNSESNIVGTAILKRKGYVRTATLTYTTSPVNGSYYFIDANGNQQDIVCHDHQCAKSTNGGAFTTFLSTAGGASIPTRWSFVDVNGTLYGANNLRDKVFTYDGTTVIYSTQIPQGSILELTKDRLVVADVAASPNSVYYSGSGSYGLFTVGVNSADPYVDAIGTPGDRTTGLKYSQGRLYIWKTSSLTECLLGDQYTSRCNSDSNLIGTSDPASIVETPGAIFFRGQDRNFWALDGAGIHLISRKISGFVSSQTLGTQQSNTQTSQSDWQSGTQTPSGTWNTATTSGYIFDSSNTWVDTVAADFSSGTVPAALSTYAVTNSLQFSSAAYLIPNGDFGTGSLARWTCTVAGAGAPGCSVSGGFASVQASCNGSSPDAYVRLLDGGATVYTLQYSVDSTAITGKTVDLTSLGISTRTLTATFQVTGNANNVTLQSSTFSAISTFTWTGTVVSNCGGAGNFGWATLGPIRTNRYFDISQSSATPATFFSRVFDTSFSTPIGGPFSPSTSTPQGTGLTYQIRSASSPYGAWTAWANVNNGARITNQDRYWQYLSTFTTSVGSSTPRIDDVSLPSATTGYFVTQCIQPSPGITAWGTLNCAENDLGNGSVVYAATSAASCASLPTALPDSAGFWTTQTNNAVLTIATNTAVALRFRSLLGSATDQASVDACTVYWNNGTVAPPVWGTYDSAKNAIYWAVAVSTSSSNNRVLKYDLNLDGFFPFSLNATAIRNIRNSIYFGDSTGGYWNLYGTVNNDNGTAINSYWKSKDFYGSNPFIDKTFTRVSLVAKNQVTGSLSATYTLGNASSGTYTVSLSTTSGITYVHANRALPILSPFAFINLNFGNNALTPWEVDGLLIDYTEFPWKAQNP